MPTPYGSPPTGFHPYSPWGWNSPWAHTPSYFRPYHVKYAASRSSIFQKQPYVQKDRFEKKNRSRVQESGQAGLPGEKDDCKDKSSDMSSSDEKPINVLKTSANNGKRREKPAINIPSAKLNKRS
ncbi:hypothetical protein BAE44_0024663 [Dichanthelium oligosanthes]|uniref:Uncharacterized protein n=1 Tax=Dichanthelium oligosanthes TaxID=888268 RepID=A0A1E5UNC1_9POAL|nr:hypothetical protein BAE44_0024663 [Dichanthelium oligosanthes]